MNTKPKSAIPAKFRKIIYFQGGTPAERFCASLEPYGSEATYYRLEEVLQHQFSPIMAQILIDGGCNQQCCHCFLGLAKTRTPTKSADLLKVSLAFETQGFIVTPYPAEPLINHTVYFDYIRRLNPFAHFMTNGSALLSQQPISDFTKIITAAPFAFLYVSLHGACAETHEQITRTPGSFNATRETIRKLGLISNEKGLKLALNVVVYKENIAELGQILQIALKNGFRRLYLIRLFPTAESEFPSNWLLDRAAILETLLIVARLRRLYGKRIWIEMGASWGPNFHMQGIWHYFGRQMIMGDFMHYCFAAEREFAIHPTKREVYPCMIMSGNPALKIGDLDEKLDIIFTPLGNRLKNWHEEWVTHAQGACHPSHCPYSEICHGGCRGAAIAMHFYRTQQLEWFAPFPDCITNVLREFSLTL